MNNKVFEGKYNILKILGEGGVGRVYLARNVKLDNLWAIKQMSKKSSDEFDLLAEPNILKRLNHPSLPRIVDIFEDSDHIYIVEDYIEGVSLDKALKDLGKYPEKKVIEWAKQICDVLIYLHNQKPNPIIYRDMKPGNLIVNEDGNIKVIDFGIAREYKAHATEDTMYVGTRGYAAPEQYGTSQTDERSDIYSLGVTLYHLLTGKGPNEPPFEIKPVRQLNPKLSTGIEHIIKKCTQLDPSKRYQNVQNLLKDLKDIHRLNTDYKRRRAFLEVRILLYLILISASISLVSLGIQQQGIEKEEAYGDLLVEAQEYLQGNDFINSIELYNQANTYYPHRIDGYIGIANTYLKEMQYDKCIKYISEDIEPVIIGASQNAELNYIKGTAYYELKDYQKSASYLQRASEINPDAENYSRDYGVVLAKIGHIDEAQDVLEEMKDKNMSDGATQYVYGEILCNQDNFQEAVNVFTSLIETDSDEEILRKAYISVGEITRDHGRDLEGSYLRGIEVLSTAEGKLKNKNDVIITEILAELYYRHGTSVTDSSERKQAYLTSAQLFRGLIDTGYIRPYLYRNIAILQQNMKDYEACEQTLNEMKEVYPDNHQVYIQYAFLYAEIENTKKNEYRDYQKVVDNYQRAAQYAPEGESSQDLLPLKSLIDELRDKKWID